MSQADWPSEQIPARPPEPEVSKTSLPTLTADELDARIKQREREMETAPCYRCDHSPAAPDPGCPCCHDAHTPDLDGNFTGATVEEFAAMKEKMRP